MDHGFTNKCMCRYRVIVTMQCDIEIADDLASRVEKHGDMERLLSDIIRPTVVTERERFVAISDQNRAFFDGLQLDSLWRVTDVCSAVEIDQMTEPRTLLYDKHGNFAYDVEDELEAIADDRAAVEARAALYARAAGQS